MLKAGFPSDHYLLEAVLRVKLKARPAKTTPPQKLDYQSVTATQKRQYNLKFREYYGGTSQQPHPDSPDTTWFVYTDGSGSAGKCSATTPAGWGFAVVEADEEIHSASGPVQTNSSSPLSLGATVGSNNTGELTAWLEAALCLITLEQPPATVVFRFDSKWAAGVARDQPTEKA